MHSVERVGVDGFELVAGLCRLLEKYVQLERLVGCARDLVGPEGGVVTEHDDLALSFGVLAGAEAQEHLVSAILKSVKGDIR